MSNTFSKFIYIDDITKTPKLINKSEFKARKRSDIDEEKYTILESWNLDNVLYSFIQFWNSKNKNEEAKILEDLNLIDLKGCKKLAVIYLMWQFKHLHFTQWELAYICQLNPKKVYDIWKELKIKKYLTLNHQGLYFWKIWDFRKKHCFDDLNKGFFTRMYKKNKLYKNITNIKEKKQPLNFDDLTFSDDEENEEAKPSKIEDLKLSDLSNQNNPVNTNTPPLHKLKQENPLKLTTEQIQEVLNTAKDYENNFFIKCMDKIERMEKILKISKNELSKLTEAEYLKKISFLDEENKQSFLVVFKMLKKWDS